MTGKTRILAVVLLLSLGLNLFVGGHMLMRAWHHHPMFDRDRPEMPRHVRDQLHTAMKANKAELRARAADVKAQYARLAAEIEREPFNRAKVEQEAAALRAAYARMHQTAQTAIFDTAAKMSPEERKALAAATRKMSKKVDRMERRDGE